MKNVVITAAQLKAIPVVAKTTKNGVRECREFRLGDVYASFWGEPTKDKHEFAYRPNANALAKGTFICIDNSTQRELTVIKVEDLETVAATPQVKSATLALLGL